MFQSFLFLVFLVLVVNRSGGSPQSGVVASEFVDLVGDDKDAEEHGGDKKTEQPSCHPYSSLLQSDGATLNYNKHK